MGRLISDKYKQWEQECRERFNTLKSNEEELNKIFIEIYGLQDELSPEVEDRDVSVRLADLQREIKSLISYLIGIEMGRYSLDVEGLAYAGGEWNPMKYVTYQPDNDGIIPVYTQLGMQDGLTARIIKLIKHIYGEDTYRENIDFIAEALGKNSNESSEETLNRYLNDSFYAEVEDVRIQLETAEGREKLRLDKLYKVLIARQKEMIEYGQVLDHMANQYIVLDLDDGVKVNYAKFQGIEIVNDNGAKVKKDLLVPIK